MTNCVPIIAVPDVQKSSLWYQKLLGCSSAHGGSEFEMLADKSGSLFLFLHKWSIHDHPTMAQPSELPGNGIILYMTVDNLQDVWNNAKKLKAQIESEPKVSNNSGKEEFCIRDLDGYYLMIC